ncbi:MAG: DUF2721 domain-containing protein [Ktedonobacterales bacterium]
MSVEIVTQIIQAIVAPAVMMTSGAILIGGMLAIYSSINDRLRLMTRERLELLRMPDGSFSATAAMGTAYTSERLLELDRQMPSLLHRHLLVHNALLAVFSALGIFVLTMLVIAIAAVSGSTVIASLALIIFLIGTGALLLGVLIMAISIRNSQFALDFEVRRVLKLGK